MTKTAKKPRQSKQDALYATQLQIGLSPTTWRAVRAAAVKAVDSKLARFGFIPAFFPLIDKALASVRKGNYELGEPNVYISGMVSSWVAIADAVSKYGDMVAQDGERVIACRASQILNARREVDDGE